MVARGMVGNSSGCKKRSGNQKLDATKDVIVHQTTLVSRSQMDTCQPRSGTKKINGDMFSLRSIRLLLLVRLQSLVLPWTLLYSCNFISISFSKYHRPSTSCTLQALILFSSYTLLPLTTYGTPCSFHWYLFHCSSSSCSSCSCTASSALQLPLLHPLLLLLLREHHD